MPGRVSIKKMTTPLKISCGRAIAWLALHGPLEFSGQFLDYDDPRISRPTLDFFGAK